jgi:hypothetical protein
MTIRHNWAVFCDAVVTCKGHMSLMTAYLRNEDVKMDMIYFKKYSKCIVTSR